MFNFFYDGIDPPEKAMNPKITFPQAMFICGSISAKVDIIIQPYRMGGDRICC